MYSRIKNKDVRNLVNYIYEDVSNPRMLSGIAGGFMVNAGLIMTLSGAGAIVGVPLLVAGTICTAYSSGLINVDKKTKKISMNFTQRNELEFGISMGLDACDLGSEYNVVSKSVKTKSVVKAIKTVRPEIKKGIQENVWKIGLTKGYYKYTKNKVIGENKKEIAKEIMKSYIISNYVTYVADNVYGRK